MGHFHENVVELLHKQFQSELLPIIYRSKFRLQLPEYTLKISVGKSYPRNHLFLIVISKIFFLLVRLVYNWKTGYSYSELQRIRFEHKLDMACCWHFNYRSGNTANGFNYSTSKQLI